MIEDGVRLDAEGAPISQEPLKSHHVFLYLSLGCGEDLTDMLIKHGLRVNRNLMAKLFQAYANRACDSEAWRRGEYAKVFECSKA